jgi:hypothetical protein
VKEKLFHVMKAVTGVAFHGTVFHICLCEACVSATVCKGRGRGRGRGKVVPMLNQVPGHEDAFLTQH